MRASASSCICRLAQAQIPAKSSLRHVQPPSTSSSLLFPSIVGSSCSRQALQQRSITSTPARREGEPDATAAAADVAAAPAGGAGASDKVESLEDWMKGPEAKRYKRPLAGRANWIGKTPFPLNPSFRPPTPISHGQKERIYRQFIESLKSTNASTSDLPEDGLSPKSETYHARKIAQKYNISIDRVKAIIRLKALEYNTAAAGKELQMKFCNAMESAMGVSTGNNDYVSVEEALDVQAETEALYKTGRKTTWLMIDEENPSDLAEEEAEITKRQLKTERASKRREGTDEVPRDVREGVRSRRRVLANPKSEKRNVRPEIEFVDVPGQKAVP